MAAILFLAFSSDLSTSLILLLYSFLRMVLSFLIILLVVFPLVHSVMMDMFPLSWSICFWSLCCQAGAPPFGFLLVVGLGGIILLVISKAAVYCIWLVVVRSMLSVDVSSIILSKILTTLFSFLSFFTLVISFSLSLAGIWLPQAALGIHLSVGHSHSQHHHLVFHDMEVVLGVLVQGWLQVLQVPGW